MLRAKPSRFVIARIKRFFENITAGF